MAFGTSGNGRGAASARSGAWTRAFAAVAALGVVGLVAGMAPAAADTAPVGPVARYIVRFAPGTPGAGDNSAVRTVVNQVQGTVRGENGEGVVADLTPTALTGLSQTPGVMVSADAPVTLDPLSTTATTTTRDATDLFHTVTNADPLVTAGNDGTGVTVAVLDTGIAPLPDFGKRIIGGVDLSGEGSYTKDSYGHGTFVAGLIAGNGASSGGRYIGEAPGANLVAIKVAGASGAVSTSKVIEGIEWAITNQAKYSIRVLNLSLGTSAIESTTTAPLNAAVERAWQSGIVVVASAGNFGPANGSISKPGDDPLVITAGATDDNGTPVTTDDTVPSFSSVGPTWADGWIKPDVAVPGRSVVSVMAPGSTVALAHPEGMVGTTNFRGSGTSFSAAIMSGAAALVIDANPTLNLTPDLVKGRVLGTTSRGPVGNPMVDGHGLLNVQAAAGASNIVFSQSNVVRWGQGGLSGGAPNASPTPVLPGFLFSDPAQAWRASSWNGSAWNGSAWNGGAWNGGAWNGGAWNGGAWNGGAWNGGAWNGGSAWNGGAWNGSAWNGSAWNGSAWNGGAWNGSGWNGSGWNGGAWNGSGWNWATWSGSGWNGSAWNGTAWNGSAWNGTAWNGSAWNGSGWNWATWSGSGWNGSAWNGSGWNGSSWN